MMTTKNDERERIYQDDELHKLQMELRNRRTNWEFAAMWATTGFVVGLMLMYLLMQIGG